MKTRSIAGLTLWYDAEEGEAADLIGGACEKTVRLVGDQWGIEPQEDLRVYVMTSWSRFLFQAAPWSWRVLLAVTLPLWVSRVRRMWVLAGGWEQRFGKRRTLGVKSPRVMELADRSMGDRVFVLERDIEVKVEHVTCHELTHALTTHLNLPVWLKEGVAMVAVDLYAGQPTVLPETLKDLAEKAPQSGATGARRPSLEDREAFLFQYILGYWLTRYLHETHPGLLRDLLSEPHAHDELEGRVADRLGLDRQALWDRIGGVVADHFGQEQATEAV